MTRPRIVDHIPYCPTCADEELRQEETRIAKYDQAIRILDGYIDVTEEAHMSSESIDSIVYCPQCQQEWHPLDVEAAANHQAEETQP